MFLLSLFFTAHANAGILKTRGIVAEDFYDYEYAKHAWDTLSTRKLLEAEEGRYDGGFDAWLALFMKDRKAALRQKAALEGSKDFQRRYDLQLAYDHWRDTFYLPWQGTYYAKKVSFDDRLANLNTVRAVTPCTVQRRVISNCGVLPDWRSVAHKKADQEMMERVAKKHK